MWSSRANSAWSGREGCCLEPLAAPTGQLQHGPLGICSKGLPSFTGNYSPFKKQLLPCYWAVETECLTMGHQVTMRPELLITKWVLSDPPRHKVGHVQQYSINKWKWYIWDWSWAVPEGTSKVHEYVAQMPMVPTPATLPFLSQPAPIAWWGVPHNQLTEEVKTQA